MTCPDAPLLGKACTSDDACSTSPTAARCIDGVCAKTPHSGQCYDDSLCGGSTCEGASFPCKTGTCSGGVPWKGCKEAGECVLVQQQSTGLQCISVEAANASQLAVFIQTECYGFAAMCTCKEPPSPDLLPSCQNQECTKVQVSESPLSACVEDSDCTLQGADCCTDCTTKPERTVAIRKDAVDAFRKDACQPDELTTCAKCPATFTTVQAVCDKSKGHCAVKSAQ